MHSAQKSPFLSTLPARGATPAPIRGKNSRPISIHAPREGSDVLSSEWIQEGKEFLSTLPARGATQPFDSVDELGGYFYPRSPRGERRKMHDYFTSCLPISIHAPREGSDALCGPLYPVVPISIHAPREGSDGVDLLGLLGRVRISIHAPREGSDSKCAEK